MDCSGCPKISVVMSVYNGQRYVRPAVESILGQTFGDFELILVDDGSSDGSSNILQEYARKDSRTVLLVNEENIGLTKSLNRGLAKAKGEYIARQDSDDLSDPRRFELQVDYLDRHQQVGLLGTAFHYVDGEGRRLGVCRPSCSDTMIRWGMMMQTASVFCHTSVMMRRSVLAEHNLSYDESLRYAQDKDLWVRLMKFTKGANLQRPLVWFRRHPGSISVARRAEQRRIALEVSRGLMNELLDEQISLSEVESLLSGKGFFRERELGYCRLYAQLINGFQRHVQADPGPMCEIRLVGALKLLRRVPMRMYGSLLGSGVLGSILRGCPVRGLAGVPWRLARRAARAFDSRRTGTMAIRSS